MLAVSHVSKDYPSPEGSIAILHDASLAVESGDAAAITGPSGSGKSTLLNVIGGLDRVTSGEVLLDGRRIDNLSENELVEVRRGKIACVFQQYHLLPSLTAHENVLLPIMFGGGRDGKVQALDILKRVGLEKRSWHKPGQLSGGEQQRVAIARALVSGPELILADEPTGNMDQRTGSEILDLFDEINQEGHTIIMVTHDPEIAKRAREIIFLKDGRLVERTMNRDKKGVLVNVKKNVA